jgi:hypothetical protein
MSVLDYTKLDAARSAKTIEALGQLLADMQVFYTNLRGFHWNVKGNLFYRMHAYFEDAYNAYATHIDDIAERILQLGGQPDSHFSTYLKVAKVQEQCSKCLDELGMAKNVLETYGFLLQEERTILLGLDDSDAATNDMLTSLIVEQEKAIWMLNAMLQK